MGTALSRQKRVIWRSAGLCTPFSLICKIFKKYLKIVLDLNWLSCYLTFNLHRLKNVVRISLYAQNSPIGEKGGMGI